MYYFYYTKNWTCGIFMILLVLTGCKNKEQTSGYRLIHQQGNAFGTTYHIAYEHKHSIAKQKWDEIIMQMNACFSTYDTESLISRINQGKITDTIKDDSFIEVFKIAKELYQKTDGYFDPTVGKLVNFWNFGSEKIKKKDSLTLLKIIDNIGFDKININDKRILETQTEDIYLDFNAHAKGHAVDVFANYLESQNIHNFLVEIGGEIRTKGRKTISSTPWKVGLEDPNFDGTQSYTKVLVLEGKAMATSGSYRKYKIDSTSKQRYTHIINAHLKHPIASNMLSVSVINEKCSYADGYATALMGMGFEKTKKWASQHTDIPIYCMVWEDEHLETYSFNNFKKYMLNNKQKP